MKFKDYIHDLEIDKQGVTIDPKGIEGDIPQKTLKNVYVRGVNHSNTIPDAKMYSEYKFNQANVVGWFATKANIAEGYVITIPDSEDKKEFGKEVFRIYWSKGTTIVKFDLKKGKVYFLDNNYYEENNKVKWQSPISYQRFFVDNNKDSFKAFKII